MYEAPVPAVNPDGNFDNAPVANPTTLSQVSGCDPACRGAPDHTQFGLVGRVLPVGHRISSSSLLRQRLNHASVLLDMTNGWVINLRTGRLSAHSVFSRSAALKAAVSTVALALVATCAGPHHAKQAGPKLGTVSNRGPLLALASATWGQTTTRPNLPIFLGGNVEISNTSSVPIRIISVRADHAVHMKLFGAGYITSMSKDGVGGFGGQTGDQTLEEAANSDEIDNRVADGWDSLRPLVGGLIGPCCRLHYYLLLAYMPDTTANSGSVSGVDITYRAGNGRIYQTYADGVTSFCTEKASVDECNLESKLQGEVLNRATEAKAGAEVMDKSGSWHG